MNPEQGERGVPLAALQRQVRYLVEDLRQQVARDTELRAELRREHTRAGEASRVGAAFETWLEDVLDQAAVAWVLSCVFVRFCEDNQLVGQVWIGGPDEAAPVERAMRARQHHLVANPMRNDRDWLREAFGYLRGLNATGRIFDQHNPVWHFHISGPAAEALSDFFRRGDGCRSLRDPELDTRFLGDLYEELSAHAQKTYALRQTPEFVEEFILDRVFEPAVAGFGLPDTSVIDPTCGSGHFLLGAFHRLVRRWREREPATDVEVLVERALGQVTGVDVNPFAVAVARFRLLVAALRLCQRTSLERAPSFPTRVATGDALLPWSGERGHGIDQPTIAGETTFAYSFEDADVLRDYLRPNQYTVVVGNPPYITVADGERSKRYRELYPEVCHRQYALTVPFAQRFFELARRGDHHGAGSGHVGQITANSFMKREFGKKLVNDYLAQQVELTEVIDTSGAYIPGHGTPTVILVGRNRLVSPRYSGAVRTVLGIRGEPSEPADPARGLVWTAIVNQIDDPGSESDHVSVADLDRSRLATHPWSLSGGGAEELRRSIEESPTKLNNLIQDTGRTTHTGLDDAFYLSGSAAKTRRLSPFTVPVVLGEDVRDFLLTPTVVTLFPYDVHGDPRELAGREEVFYWRMRTVLKARVDFGQKPEERGLRWFDHSMFFANRYRAPLSIAFAFVATHNHFVLDRGGKVFNRSAPVIKLPEGAGEDEHLRLLGVLNSSTACFWLKQVSHNKGSTVNSKGARQTTVPWENFYEFTGTKLQEFPLPAAYPLELARELDRLAGRLQEVSPAGVAASGVPTRERLAAARQEWHDIRARMVALQEELDWRVYHHYGLLDEDLTVDDPPPVALGERAFEIVLARRVEAGEVHTEWFHRHGSTPVTELPAHWPKDYRDVVRRRVELIGADRNLGLLERPEHKRRWSSEGWEASQTRALREWLLDRLEAPAVWGGDPEPLSVAQLADRVRHDHEFLAVLDLWVGHDQHELVTSLGALVADEHVPFLAADRYKPSGLRKRAQWERAWEQQRREDAGERVEVEVPPRYTSADFARPSYWRNRGKLDVPKERFISYPGMARDGDPTVLLGWAGWDQLAQARAIAAVYLDRKQRAGWPAEKLLPLLAGLAELEPWLHQWHAAPEPGFPGSPAEFITNLVDTELAAAGVDRAGLATVRGLPR